MASTANNSDNPKRKPLHEKYDTKQRQNQNIGQTDSRNVSQASLNSSCSLKNRSFSSQQKLVKESKPQGHGFGSSCTTGRLPKTTSREQSLEKRSGSNSSRTFSARRLEKKLSQEINLLATEDQPIFKQALPSHQPSQTFAPYLVAEESKSVDYAQSYFLQKEADELAQELLHKETDLFNNPDLKRLIAETFFDEDQEPGKNFEAPPNQRRNQRQVAFNNEEQRAVVLFLCRQLKQIRREVAQQRRYQMDHWEPPIPPVQPQVEGGFKKMTSMFCLVLLVFVVVVPLSLVKCQVVFNVDHRNNTAIFEQNLQWAVGPAEIEVPLIFRIAKVAFDHFYQKGVLNKTVEHGAPKISVSSDYVTPRQLADSKKSPKTSSDNTLPQNQENRKDRRARMAEQEEKKRIAQAEKDKEKKPEAK